MRKLILNALTMLLVIAWIPGNSQNSTCSDLQQNLDETQQKLDRIEALKISLDDFFTLMENPSALDGIPEEIANCEHRINFLERKINAGDGAPELIKELESNRARIQLLNLRMSKSFNKTTINKDPRFVQQKKDQSRLSNDELEIKLQKARITQEMKNNNCIIVVSKPGELDDIMKEEKPVNKNDRPAVGGGWAGNWKYTDPRAGDFIFNVAGNGSLVSGTLTNNYREITSKYTLKGCEMLNEKKLRCNFTALFEDEEKYMDATGSVDLELEGSKLQSWWRESAAPEVRWKPGYEKTIKRVRNPMVIPITFTRQ